MSTKTNIVLDKILKGFLINKHHEINYIANIVVELEKDTHLQYAIVDEGYEDDTELNFIQVRKTLVVSYKNTDDVYRKKLLMIKASEKTNAQVSIDVEKIYPKDLFLETLNQTGKVLLSAETGGAQPGGAQPGGVPPGGATVQTGGGGRSDNEPKKHWYQDPWIIGAVIVGVLLVSVMFSHRRRNVSNSLFLE